MNFDEAAGKRAAEITRLILRERAVVFGYIMTQTGNYADAEDVFQEVCATVCEKFGEFTGDFRAWALTIARFKVLSHYQKRRGMKLTPELAELMAAEAVDLEPSRETAALRLCLERLKGKSREIMLGRFGRGLSCQDVAKSVGWTANAVYVALSRIKRSLEDCVKARLA
ncbi:MAG TPA: sigma-70 family RNA polymerase sigma factor [Planctomycetota bacterium]